MTTDEQIQDLKAQVARLEQQLRIQAGAHQALQNQLEAIQRQLPRKIGATPPWPTLPTVTIQA